MATDVDEILDLLSGGLSVDHVQAASDELHASRTRYLQHQQLLEELRLTCDPNDRTPGATAWMERVKVATTAPRLLLQTGTETVSVQDESAVGSTAHLLGVHPSVLLSSLGNDHALQEHLSIVVQSVEEQLVQQVQTLRATMPNRDQAKDTPAHGLGGQRHNDDLTTRISNKQQACKAERAAAAAALQLQLQLASKILLLLLQAATDVLVFAEQEVVDKQQNLDQFKVRVKTEHCRSLAKKCQVVELQVKVATYARDMMPALGTIHTELSQTAEELGNTIKEIQMKLSSYEELGQPFQQVVQQYQRLRGELAYAQQQLSTFTELETELLQRDGA